MVSHNARTQPASRPTGWAEMMTGGFTAWSELAQLAIDQLAAQTKALGDFYTAGLTGVRLWPSQQELLLMVETQAEQLADGCRHTLDDLKRQGDAGPAPILPD
jgi:hypothetical protein